MYINNSPFQRDKWRPTARSCRNHKRESNDKQKKKRKKKYNTEIGRYSKGIVCVRFHMLKVIAFIYNNI